MIHLRGSSGEGEFKGERSKSRVTSDFRRGRLISGAQRYLFTVKMQRRTAHSSAIDLGFQVLVDAAMVG